jgi:hypothetical protein
MKTASVHLLLLSKSPLAALSIAIWSPHAQIAIEETDIGDLMSVYVCLSNKVDDILKSRLFWKILDLMAIWRAKKGHGNVRLSQTPNE